MPDTSRTHFPHRPRPRRTLRNEGELDGEGIGRLLSARGQRRWLRVAGSSLFGAAAVAAQAQTAAQLPAAPVPNTVSVSGPGTGTQTLGGGTGGGFPIQLNTQSSLVNPYLGSIQARPATPEALPLAFEDALHMGVENNLGLVYAQEGVEQNRSQRLTAINVLLPNIDVRGGTSFHQYNLAAEGFRPSVFPQFAAALGPSLANLKIPTVVKVDVTQGTATYSQYLFDLSGVSLIHAVGHLVKSAGYSASSARGLVVQNVGIAYLTVIAAQSQVAFDRSLLATDESVLYQTAQEHLAGTVANLDELRARVQVGVQQQALTADEGSLAKAKIALNRAIGLAPEQEIVVSDAAPFAELEPMPAEDGEKEALGNRQDYQSAIEQVTAAEYERTAVKRERYPTLVFNADYGVQGISGGIYHGIFDAIGTLQVPIFQEPRFRADRATAEFQLANARAQVANIHDQIRQQVRDALIDLRTATDSLGVARSNAELGRVALDQSVERFRAGVEDNLPSIEAASTLAQAQGQLVNATFEYNQAKLNLARALGLLGEQKFHPEWGVRKPAGVLSDRAAEGR